MTLFRLIKDVDDLSVQRAGIRLNSDMSSLQLVSVWLTPDLLLPAGGALAEGFQERLREFQMFERTFEVQKTNQTMRLFQCGQ